jgi:hypothetical protein
MEVFYEDLVGKWRKADTGSIFDFRRDRNLTVYVEGKMGGHNEVSLQYQIITKDRQSWLAFGSWKARFVVMHTKTKPPFFALYTSKGIVDFEKIPY